MAKGVNVDGVLVTWGDRLFYPGNRMVKGGIQPKLRGDALRRRAAAIRSRIEATVVRRPPQVVVKVTGGGRCTRAIAAHFRYISKNGRLDIEDDRGESIKGAHAVRGLVDDWRFGGSLIAAEVDSGGRRECFNVMLSMPRGTDPLAVQRAAREFAKAELAGHKYVMVLHDHQANPHVHISVRAESRVGTRLNPRKADLRRWRETFAEKLRELGIEADASPQATRVRSWTPHALWQIKARDSGRLRIPPKQARTSILVARASEAWSAIESVLMQSADPMDVRLGGAVAGFIQDGLTARGRGAALHPASQLRNSGRVPNSPSVLVAADRRNGPSR
jgi:hypothetical protein